jgi:hypothetical protein
MFMVATYGSRPFALKSNARPGQMALADHNCMNEKLKMGPSARRLAVKRGEKDKDMFDASGPALRRRSGGDGRWTFAMNGGACRGITWRAG